MAGGSSGVVVREALGELMLDDADHVAVMGRAVVRVQHLEAVERVTVAGGVDLRLDDVVAHALEKAADPREQVLLVGV